MTCPPELMLSMYADRALEAGDSAAIESHTATCPGCQARLAALRAEARILAAALAHGLENSTVPAFERPASRTAIAASAALLLVATGLVSASPGLLGFSVPVPLAWLNPFDSGRLVDIAIRVTLFLAQHGDAIMNSIIEMVAAATLTSLVAWAAFALRKRRSTPLLLGWLVCVFAALPAPSQALEIRYEKEGNVSVPAGERIADTLIAAGETVEIDGEVEGDLIAVGRRVIIRGRVGGLLITAASTVTLDGEVGGSVIGAGEMVDLTSNRIGRNLYGFGATVRTSARTRIEQNAIVFAEQAHFAGPVGRDVLGFAEEIEVGSAVDGALKAYAGRVTLLSTASIAGDLTAHLPQEDALTLSPGAVVGGKVTTLLHEVEERGNRYATSEFWLFQLLRFAAAFLTGAVVLALVPGLRRAALDGPRETLVAGGVGLVTIVATPIIAVLVAITFIGIPLALFGMSLWFAGLYLAKVVLAHFIGARLIEAYGRSAHFLGALAIGLLLVIAAVILPFVGPLLNFVLTICGLGLLVLLVWRAVRRHPLTDGPAR